MFCVFGLGNPEDKYIFTRHNIGFLVIDKLLSRKNLKLKLLNKCESAYCNFILNNEKHLLVKPVKYMNNSGRAVNKIIQYFGIEQNKIIIIADDINIGYGKIRIRKEGGHGGHNGLRSIINALNNKEFVRVRIGIGDKPEGYPMDKYVLSRFNSDEMKNLENIVEYTADSVEDILNNEVIEKVMTNYNNKDIRIT